MTDHQHPITPPPELRRQWLDNDHFPMVTGTNDLLSITRDRLRNVMDQAAQWGADHELEACCAELPGLDDYLRAARRPEPPSLKEQALKELRQLPIDPELGVCASALDTIRAALEALDD